MNRYFCKMFVLSLQYLRFSEKPFEKLGSLKYFVKELKGLNDDAKHEYVFNPSKFDV